MTDENASSVTNSTNKRVRFGETPLTTNDLTSPSNDSANLSSKGCALLSARTYAVTLRRHLSPIVKKAAESHIDMLHKLVCKMDQYRKMEDDYDFLPRSARNASNFEFSVSKKVEDNPEFLVIQAETDAIVKDFKLALKQKVMSTLKIDCTILRDDLFEQLCIKLHLVIQAHLITEQLNLDPHKVISTILHYDFNELFCHTDLDLPELQLKYKDTHNLLEFPFPLGNLTLNAMDLTVDTPTHAGTPEQTNIIVRNSCLPAKNLILGAFTRPGVAYFARIESIKIDVSLKKLTETNTLEEATEATKNRLDAEVSVDSELLEELVRKKVQLQTKKVNAELGQLKKQMAELTKSLPEITSSKAKNTRRGQKQKKVGASNPKKSTTRTTDRKADAPVKDATKGQSERKKRKGTKKKQVRKQK